MFPTSPPLIPMINNRYLSNKELILFDIFKTQIRGMHSIGELRYVANANMFPGGIWAYNLLKSFVKIYRGNNEREKYLNSYRF